jgi:hypothetical protein
MRVQRTRSSPSALRSPLTRHPLGGLSSLTSITRAVLLAMVVILGGITGCTTSSGGNSQGAQVGQVVRVGPQPGVISTDPVRLSIKDHQQIHWIAEETMKVGFPIDGFPMLGDGNRVTEPPFVNMSLGGIHTRTWFFPEFNTDRCNSGEINPALLQLLEKAAGRQLEYSYEYTLRGKTSTAYLIITE